MKKILYFILILLLVSYSIVIANKIISSPRPFVDWDESIYMQVGREMVREKSLIPLWLGEPWLEKPPLVPLTYGFVGLIPQKPEITTRLFSLGLSIIALIMIFLWAKKTFRMLSMPGQTAEWLALTVCTITALNPVFIRRSQEVNTDVWLLIGWLGYLLAYPRFRYSLFFLFIGVFSKSLLGLYPLFITAAYELYKYFRKESPHFKKTLSILGVQFAIMMIWYILMIVLYGRTFVEVHFIDHLLRRVTQSIESHFGNRTYYLDIIIEQYGWYLILCAVSIALAFYMFIKDKSPRTILHVLYLLPFFLFLNLTKTKIAWYIYPVIPGVALLLVYPVSLLRNKYIIMIAAATILAVAIYDGYYNKKIMSMYYSTENPKYRVAIQAKNDCDSLHMLLDGGSREMFATLKKLDLLISTSFVYGNNPSMIYYYGKPIKFYRDTEEFKRSVDELQTGECITLEEKENEYFANRPDIKVIGKYEWQLLMKKGEAIR